MDSRLSICRRAAPSTFRHSSEHLKTTKFSASSKCAFWFFTSRFALEPHTDLDFFPKEEVRILKKKKNAKIVCFLFILKPE